jgi:hypothetical protein
MECNDCKYKRYGTFGEMYCSLFKIPIKNVAYCSEQRSESLSKKLVKSIKDLKI